MTLLGVNLDYQLPSPVYSHLPPLRDFTRTPDFTKIDFQYTPPRFAKYNLTPPENPQVNPVEAVVFGCMIGAISTLFTAMILTRVSFESKTKTAIAFAVGAAVPILMYTNPLIGIVAFAILFVTGCAICKKPSSTDGLLKWLTPDERRTLSPLEAAMQRDWDAHFQRREEQLRQNIRQMRPRFHPPVIHLWDQMPPPRFVLPHFFFNDFPAFQDLQPRHIAGG